ncbi:MAG: hypothetical protein HKN49_07250 [Gammaproteobacteria bacterium]|nr:hypothetical protein [Gammaproteobacteria bacterium]
MTTLLSRGILGLAAMTLLAATASANLLVNPGFEDTPFAGAEEAGVGTGWTGFGANFRVQQAGPGPCDPISCAGAHGGTVSLKNFGEAGAYQDVAATAGQAFAASIWAINPANADALVLGQIGALNIEWLNGAGDNIGTVFGDTISAATPTDVWTLLTATGVAPAGTEFARFVLITGPFDPAGPGGGAPRWDDATFEVVPIPGAILLLGSGLLGLMGIRRKKAA